jgi:hypothetical protein
MVMATREAWFNNNYLPLPRANPTPKEGWAAWGCSQRLRRMKSIAPKGIRLPYLTQCAQVQY